MVPAGYAVVVAVVVLLGAVTQASRAVARQAHGLRSSVGDLAELRRALIPLRAQLEANAEAADRVDPRSEGPPADRPGRSGWPGASG